MQTYLITSDRGYQAIQRDDVDEPSCGPGDVLVSMRAASLNFRDFGIARGGYPRNDRCPVVPLSDGAGEVISVGEDVTRFKPGDRVIGTFVQDWIDGRPTAGQLETSLGGGIHGVLCERRAFPEHGLVELPDAYTFEQGACLPCAAVTAWHALVEAGRVASEDTVLTLGTGGVSVFAIQIALALGCNVIATTSSDEKAKRLQSMGVANVVNYQATENWDEQIRTLTGGRGVDQVVEVGGPGTLQKSLKATAVGGHIGLIGVLAGSDGAVNPLSALFDVVRISGIYVGSRTMTERLTRFAAEHRIEPVIDAVFPFEEAVEAYAHLRSGNHFGKVVIRIG